MKGAHGFDAALWIVFGISACGTLMVAGIIRRWFRRGKTVTDL